MENYKILKELRLKKKLKSKDVAKKLNFSQSLMSEYENGVYEPSINTLIKMAGIYGVSLNYLLLKEDKSITFTNEEIDIIEKFAFVLIDKLQLLKIKEKLTNEEL